MVVIMISKEEKNAINNEVVGQINDVLKKYDCEFEMDKLSVLNLSDSVTFLGNFRVQDESKLDSINKEVKEILSKYDKLTYNSQHITPCCSLPYTAVSFNFKVKNN
jgi:hypothetical protein